MVTVPIALGVLGALASIAVAGACVATLRARAASAALRASEAKYREAVELNLKMEAGSQLAGDVAHDLNDLLTVITGRIELLIASPYPSDTGLEDALEIRRAALSAARLTMPLRALSGGLREPTDAIDVNAVTARAANALQRVLGPNIEVTLALHNDIKRIKIRASHLEEIVLNLGIRARESMPNGGRLTVTTTRHMHDEPDAASGAPSEYVRMIVSDTGGGMSADAQSRLFEPLLASEGAGANTMGLANVYAIVKEAGGRIQVESSADVGTTFTIDLPATSEPSPAADPAFAEKRLTAPVLVVEDDPALRELIQRVLVGAGHEVVAAAGPRAALAALSRQPAISLMLVDVVMPEMDGYDLVAEARKISRGVHAVFMSSFAHDTTRHPGGDRFLAKPFSLESLTTTVQEALDSSRPRPPESSPSARPDGPHPHP